jgi:hypothetical protein
MALRRDYSELKAKLDPLRKIDLLTLYLQAYPGRPGDVAAGMSRDALISGLLDYADGSRRDDPDN